MCIIQLTYLQGLPRWLRSKESTCNARDTGLIPGSGRCPGGGNDNPLWYSCLENPINREAWQATVYGITKRQTRLSTHVCHVPTTQNMLTLSPEKNTKSLGTVHLSSGILNNET